MIKSISKLVWPTSNDLTLLCAYKIGFENLVNNAGVLFISGYEISIHGLPPEKRNENPVFSKMYPKEIVL